MNIESNPTVATSGRTRRTVVSVAIAVIATIPIAAGSAGASDETTSPDTTESTVPTTGHRPKRQPTPSNPQPAAIPTWTFASRSPFPTAGRTTAGSCSRRTPPGASASIFGHVANIFSDPCQWVELDPPPGPSVDDLVAAFASVPALNATEPTDVTVDGFHGKQIEFTVPDFNEDECSDG